MSSTMDLIIIVFAVLGLANSQLCTWSLTGESGVVQHPSTEPSTTVPKFVLKDENTTEHCVYYRNTGLKPTVLKFTDISLDNGTVQIKTIRQNPKGNWKLFEEFNGNLREKVITISGVRYVKIIVDKDAENFKLEYKVKSPKVLECPSLDQSVIVTDCSKGRNVGSTCSVKCSEGYTMNDIIDGALKSNFEVNCRRITQKTLAWKANLNKTLCGQGRMLKKKCRGKIKFCVPVQGEPQKGAQPVVTISKTEPTSTQLTSTTIPSTVKPKPKRRRFYGRKQKGIKSSTTSPATTTLQPISSSQNVTTAPTLQPKRRRKARRKKPKVTTLVLTSTVFPTTKPTVSSTPPPIINTAPSKPRKFRRRKRPRKATTTLKPTAHVDNVQSSSKPAEAQSIITQAANMTTVAYKPVMTQMANINTTITPKYSTVTTAPSHEIRTNAATNVSLIKTTFQPKPNVTDISTTLDPKYETPIIYEREPVVTEDLNSVEPGLANVKPTMPNVYSANSNVTKVQWVPKTPTYEYSTTAIMVPNTTETSLTTNVERYVRPMEQEPIDMVTFADLDFSRNFTEPSTTIEPLSISIKTNVSTTTTKPVLPSTITTKSTTTKQETSKASTTTTKPEVPVTTTVLSTTTVMTKASIVTTKHAIPITTTKNLAPIISIKSPTTTTKAKTTTTTKYVAPTTTTKPLTTTTKAKTTITTTKLPMRTKPKTPTTSIKPTVRPSTAKPKKVESVSSTITSKTTKPNLVPKKPFFDLFIPSVRRTTTQATTTEKPKTPKRPNVTTRKPKKPKRPKRPKIIVNTPLNLKICKKFCKMHAATRQYTQRCSDYKAPGKTEFCIMCRHSPTRPCKQYSQLVS